MSGPEQQVVPEGSGSVEETGPGTTTGRGGPPRPALIGIGVLAAIAVILLAVFLLRPGQDPVADPNATASPTAQPTAAPTSAEPTPEPTATPIPTPTPLPSGAAPLDWTDGTAPEGTVYVVEWLGDRWVAGGSAGARAATWTSTDGLTWEPAPPIPPDPVPQTDGEPGTAFWITDIVEYDGQVLAFGWNRIGCCDGGAPVVWRSTDAIGWEVLPTDGTTFESYHFPQSAATAPDGSLVLGTGTGLGSGWASLTSSDLESWTFDAVTGEAEQASLSGIAASPTTLLAVGTEYLEFPARAQRVWGSADGRTWSELAPPAPAGLLNAVTWDPARERFLVAGEDQLGRPAIWLTSDGSGWTTITLDDGPGHVSDIDAGEGGLIVAAGTLGDPAEEIIAWSSHDGITWQIVSLGPDVLGVPFVGTGSGSAVISVSGQGPEPDYEPIWRVWHGSPN